MQDVNPESSGDPADDPEFGDPPLYEVAPGPDDTAVCEGLTLPRRRGHGVRGVLLVDAPAELVYLLDADDERQVFVGRARRPMAGDRADLQPPAPGVDHVVRAAYEQQYDVIAAPWAGAKLGEPPAALTGAVSPLLTTGTGLPL